MKLTLNITDSDVNKAIPLIAYLKSLDFISIEQEEDFVLPEWHKHLVRERIDASEPSQLLDWDKEKDTLKLD